MTRRAGPLRPDRRAISALYGAFGVLVVATVVVGIVMGAENGRTPSGSHAAEGKLADLFLSTVLSSTLEGENQSIREAMATVCQTPPCPDGTESPAHLARALEALAGPLAKGLDRRWSLELSDSSSEILAVGDLARNLPGTASRADILHPATRGFVTVTLRLAPL